MAGLNLSAWRRSVGWLVIIVAVGTVVGFGCQSDKKILYPVTGKVTANGESLDAGSVTLHPQGGEGTAGWEISGGKIKDGVYDISTGNRRGAPPGSYRVTVRSTNYSGESPPAKGATAEMPKSLIDPKFSDPGRSPLAFDVVKDPAEGAYDLQVTR